MSKYLKNNWCDETLDYTSLKWRVRHWFLHNCMCEGGYTNTMQEDELTMLLIETIPGYTNSTAKQCANWIKGCYDEKEVNETQVFHMLIDCVIRYTSVLERAQHSGLINEYIYQYYY